MKLGTKVKSVRETSRYKKGQVGTVASAVGRRDLGRNEMVVEIDEKRKLIGHKCSFVTDENRKIIVPIWHWVAK